jgi:hypothetical protein
MSIKPLSEDIYIISWNKAILIHLVIIAHLNTGKRREFLKKLFKLPSQSVQFVICQISCKCNDYK